MTYETTVRAYKNIPFQFRLKKNGYYDITGSLIGGYIAYNLEFQPYTGLNMSYYQGTGSLMTVTADSGDLPDGSLTTGTFGCLEEAGQSYAVKKLGYVNYTTAGTPTIDINTGEVSNFSNSNYLYENFGLSSADSWEINTAFMITSNTSARRQVISSMAGTGGVYAGVSFLLDANNYIVMQLGLTTSSYDNITTSFTVSPNTKYYLKGTFNGSTYEFKYSTDGTNYTSVGTISSTAKIYQSTVTRIGVYGNAVSEPLTNGTIYLADTNISVNGSEYWNPVGDYNTTAQGLLPTGVTDDGSAQTWNLFYNNGDYRLNTTSTMTGYTLVGSVAIPAHTV